MNSKEIKSKIQEEGYIQAVIMFEVIGSPEDYVVQALNNHMDKLKADKDLEVIRIDIEKPEQQDTVWSVFAEVELLVKNLEKFTWICMNFMPASVEIMAPKELVFKGRDLTNWLNDVLAQVHEIALISQQVGQQSKQMLKSMNALVRNSVLVCIDSGIHKASEIAKKIGILEKELEPVFEAMIKEKTIKKEGKNYSRK
ncbi:MAG: hypothetical protein ABH828_02635 [archaeon]